MSETEIINFLEATPETKLTKSGKQYNEISAQLKTESLVTDISAQLELLSTSRRVNLHDVQEVKEQTYKYFTACAKAGTPPLFMQLATAFGYSRQRLYSFMREHPNSETTQFLQCVQSAIASIIASQGLRRNYSDALSIFLLKNSGNGLRDTVEIDTFQRDPMEDARTASEIMQKYSDISEEE